MDRQIRKCKFQATSERKNRLIKFEHPSNDSFACITSIGTKGQKLPEQQLAFILYYGSSKFNRSYPRRELSSLKRYSWEIAQCCIR